MGCVAVGYFIQADGRTTGHKNPVDEVPDGPVILLDAAHHNFHVTEGFIDPFAQLAASDGYRTIVGTSKFTPEFLRSFDIVMVITALPFEFTSKTEVTTEITFTDAEIEALHDWVFSGGSLLVLNSLHWLSRDL